jgi:hypothetical protein
MHFGRQSNQSGGKHQAYVRIAAFAGGLCGPPHRSRVQLFRSRVQPFRSQVQPFRPWLQPLGSAFRTGRLDQAQYTGTAPTPGRSCWRLAEAMSPRLMRAMLAISQGGSGQMLLPAG